MRWRIPNHVVCIVSVGVAVLVLEISLHGPRMFRHMLHQQASIDQLRAHIAMEDLIAVMVAHMRLNQRRSGAELSAKRTEGCGAELLLPSFV